MKKVLVLIISLVFVFALASCSKGYTDISNDELEEMLLTPSEYQFVDVRTSAEFYDSKIPGFNINKDFYIFENDYSILDNLDKSIPTVIMCNSGNRSVDASKIFVELGFVKVYNLKDGIEGWDGPTE